MLESKLQNQALTSLLAGQDNTAFAITYTLHLLGQHPTIRERVVDEIEPVVGDGRPTVRNLSGLSLLDRVFNESLRISPPVYNIQRVTDREVDLQGYRLPAGKQVIVSVVSIHCNDDCWQDPL